MIRVAAALGALGILTAVPALAAGDPPAPTARTFAGPWRMATADGRRHCPLVLKADKAGKGAAKGYAIAIDRKACGDAFPIQSVAAWEPYGGLIVLLSETGAPVATFTETEAGIYASSGDPVYFLRPAK
jgi:hypothetical protein